MKPEHGAPAPRLSVENLTVKYGRLHALTDISFEVPSGTVYAVVGGNGAGKSTLLKAILGAVRYDGAIALNGDPMDGLDVSRRLREGVSLVPQGREIFPRLTVTKNLEIAADVAHVDHREIAGLFERFPILAKVANRNAGVLSGGEQQILALARALLVSPRLLLLDEVATGLAPVIVTTALDTVRELRDSGVSIVMAEPMASRIESVVDRGMVLRRGISDGVDIDAGVLEQELARSMGI